MEATAKTYDQGFDKGYAMAYDSSTPYNVFIRSAVLETDFDIGVADGFEQGNRDYENERLEELSALFGDRQMEAELAQELGR